MRYIVGFLLAIGLIIFVFVLILKSFGGSPKSPTQQINLNSYSTTDTVMRLTIDGPITADQTHYEVAITVGQSEGVIQVMKGYQGNVTSSKTYDNNSTSYNAFLHALNLSGYTLNNPDPRLKDETGYCPDGNRYIYEIVDSTGNTIQHSWSTSCGGQGNYKGNPAQTLDLFEHQIPDFDALTENFLI